MARQLGGSCFQPNTVYDPISVLDGVESQNVAMRSSCPKAVNLGTRGYEDESRFWRIVGLRRSEPYMHIVSFTVINSATYFENMPLRPRRKWQPKKNLGTRDGTTAVLCAKWTAKSVLQSRVLVTIVLCTLMPQCPSPARRQNWVTTSDYHLQRLRHLRGISTVCQRRCD